MIGYFNYTVVLTYLSILSATAGIVFTLSNMGHPYIGVMFLLFSGLCDAFDGKVARTKKNRTDMERGYGIQIDSLSDLVAFGVLPACIGVALYRNSVEIFNLMPSLKEGTAGLVQGVAILLIIMLYVLTALIRLAYFNVTEEARQCTDKSARSHYTGLPVTSACLIFPTILLVQYLTPKTDITPLYFAIMLLTSIAFVSRFKMKKPNLREILILVAIGVLEAIVLTAFWVINAKN